MAAVTLHETYKEIIDKLVKHSHKVKGVEIEPYIINRMFQLMTVRTFKLLKMMDCANASTVYKGLLALDPNEIDSYVELIEGLVFYHRQEKQALRKFRSNNGVVTEPSIEDFFGKMILRTENHMDSVGKA